MAGSDTVPVTTAARNWAGNVTYHAGAIHRPASLDELRALVAASPRIRASGTRHSFNDLPDSPGVLVSLASMPPEVDVDSAAAMVRVPGGMRYAEVAERVQERGFALRNLGSLPHISVAGACATGTHGSGVRNGGLATAVRRLEVVTADGDLVTLEGGELEGAVVGLGALGVVAALTLELVPTYDVAQRVYEGLPMEVLDDHFDALVGAAYSVSLFTDWRAPRLTQVWVKRRVDEPPPAVLGEPWFSARPADAPRHPVHVISPASCNPQMDAPGPWFARLPHFRPEFTPSSGEELQSEYLIDRADAVPALRAVARVRDRIAPVLQICEIRTIAADRLWLSPSYGRDSVSIHFTWVADAAAVLAVVALVEEQLAPFAARPHWGKVFTTAPEALRQRYDRMDDFAALRRRYDPGDKFGNDFLARHLPAT